MKQVGYQGVPGAYSSIAAAQHFPRLTSIGYPTFDAVIQALRENSITYGILPIENSTSGRIADIHTLLHSDDVHIVGERFLPIHHCLIGTSTARIQEITRVYSHREALNQCKGFIREIGAEPVPHMDTAGAVDFVLAQGDPSAAALASSAAARSRGARILQRNVEDRPDNVTRFVVLALRPVPTPTRNALTSIFFETRDVPAALFKSLSGFATTGTNIIKLESFVPMTAHTDAAFYLEFEGHPDSPGPKVALTELAFYTRKLVILGTYARSPFRNGLKRPSMDNRRYSRRSRMLR